MHMYLPTHDTADSNIAEPLLMNTRHSTCAPSAPAPGQWLPSCRAVLPHHLVALNLIARVRSLVQASRLVARPHMQPAAPADEAVAEAAAVKVLHVARLSHALQGKRASYMQHEKGLRLPLCTKD
jgi:hypothetical protein